jgi:NAD(P) transhydrogenase subunit alpha
VTETLATNPGTATDAPRAPGRLTLGVPKEIHPGERRVAVVPRMAAKLAKLGFDVVLESGAGHAAAFTDQAYEEAGARIVADPLAVWGQADLVLKVREPEMNAALNRHEADLLKEGARLISFVWPAQNKELLARLAQRKATVLAMDAVPRISRAQKLDALSAMANIAGYRAVIESAAVYGRFLSVTEGREPAEAVHELLPGDVQRIRRLDPVRAAEEGAEDAVRGLAERRARGPAQRRPAQAPVGVESSQEFRDEP